MQWHLIGQHTNGYPAAGTDGRCEDNDQERATYLTVEMLDGIHGGNQDVMVARDGTLHGGDSFNGTYTCANGK
jgi:hypothetical protein